MKKDFAMTETCTASNGDKWEIYKDNAGEWRWRRTASNGSIVGASTEGYKNKSDCIANARRNGMSCTPS
jgi:uncharacterized protein YegP (UPF0339 family)